MDDFESFQPRRSFDYIPAYSDFGVYVNCYARDIHFGAFVHFYDGETVQLVRTMRRLRSAPLGEHIIVQQYKLVFDEEGNTPFSVDPLVGCLGSGMREVYATGSFYKVPRETFAAAVKSVAFVFMLDDLQYPNHFWCAGSTYCYVLQYNNYENPNELQRLTFSLEERVTCFPSECSKYDDCLPSQVWTGLCTISEMLFRGLNRTAQSQGMICTNRDKKNIPRACWAFLKSACLEADIECASRTGKRTVTVPLPGMSTIKKRKTCPKEMLSFQSQAELETFRAIFGKQSTFGVRKKTGRLGTPRTTLEVNDFVHVVMPVEVVPDQPFSNKKGIVFTHDGNEIAVAVSYVVYVYTTDVLGRATGVPLTELESLILPRRRLAQQPPDIALGQLFVFEGSTYKITTIRPETNEVLAVVDDANAIAGGGTVSFDIQQVSQLARDYLE